MGLQKNNPYDNQFNNFPEQLQNFFKDNNITPSKNPMYDVYKASTTSLLGVNTSLGNSQYDNDINQFSHVNENNVQDSINEFRAYNQPWLHKAAAGLGRVGVKVVAEVAKMPGMIGGAIAAPFAEEGEGWDTFVNNSWIKTINQMNEDINSEALPVYVKKAVSEGNLWDNISSIDFWATDGADGIGYIVSMMVPGAALKGLGAPARMVILPKESHSYVTKENILHLLWEQDQFLEKYLKN